MTTEKIKPTAHQMASMLNDYFADPNCWPHLWIEDDAINWDDESQKLFIEIAIKIKGHSILQKDITQKTDGN